jgi:FKBP-type peptidyl-prolyl cis-trans isomerase
MKQILFTLLFFCVAGLYSCRKSNVDVDIKTFDQQQITNYISSNGLTGFSRDLSGGDTTGIYYKILTPGTGKTINYPDLVSFVFTVQSFDGQFVAVDSVINHIYNYVGHVQSNNLPNGFELALINIIKTKGTRARVLVPSHLAYGVSGFGTGSSQSGNRVAGNQCLDYYVNLINNDNYTDPKTKLVVNGQDVYDDQSIVNYITANNLTGFTKTASGLWYKVTQSAVGSLPSATSLVTIQYTSTLFDGLTTSEQYNTVDGSGIAVDLANDTRKGLVEGLKLVPPGTKLTLLIPSRLAFGYSSYSDSTIPILSCLKYDINVISVQ